MEERFVDNGDGTVTDKRTSLMWMKNDSFNNLKKFLTFRQAKKLLDKTNQEAFAGHSDWRFPSKQEAHSLFLPDKTIYIMDKYEMEIYIDPAFQKGCGYDTWTSNTRGKITAYVYSFSSGTGGHKDVDDNLDSSIRLLRGTMPDDVAASFGKAPPKKGLTTINRK